MTDANELEKKIEAARKKATDPELRAAIDELAQLALVRDRERHTFRELFDFAPEAYFVTDPWGVILEANVAATELLGVERQALHGKPLATTINREDGQRFRDVLDMILSTRRVEVELELKRPDKPPLSTTFVGGIAEDRRRIFWIARPGTPPKGMDTAAIFSDPRTAAMVRALREREDQLAVERKLRVEAESQNRAKDHFLAVLSHDLRAPLNAVLGWTQMLQKEELGPGESEKALATIERNARAQAALVAELLDVSRLSTDELALELVPQDLATLARRGVEALRATAQRKNLDVSIDTTGGPVVVMGDATRLEQVMSNLLSNALKFTPPGGSARVDVRREGAWAVLRVADSGRGIKTEDLPFVFDSFRQEARSRGPGLGLGLYIAKQLVELHGGKVTAESEGEGRGTTISVWLPARDGAIEARVPALPPKVGELAKLRVLVVEDDEDTRELMASVLQRSGAYVVTTPDVKSGIAAFVAAPPDVIVSDIGLPDEDGYALIRKIRGELASTVPALALTAYAGPQDSQRAIMAGFDAHVTKPIDPASLVMAISALVRR